MGGAGDSQGCQVTQTSNLDTPPPHPLSCPVPAAFPPTKEICSPWRSGGQQSLCEDRSQTSTTNFAGAAGTEGSGGADHGLSYKETKGNLPPPTWWVPGLIHHLLRRDWEFTQTTRSSAACLRGVRAVSWCLAHTGQKLKSEFSSLAGSHSTDGGPHFMTNPSTQLLFSPSPPPALWVPLDFQSGWGTAVDVPLALSPCLRTPGNQASFSSAWQLFGDAL